MSLGDQAAHFKKKVASQIIDVKPKVSSLGRGPLGLKRTVEDRIREQAAREAQEKSLLAKSISDEQEETSALPSHDPTGFRLSIKYEVVNYLKGHRGSKTLTEISNKVGYDIKFDSVLIEDLRRNPKITFHEDQDLYEYKPNFQVQTAGQLLELTKERYYLNIYKEEEKTPIGIELKELEDAAVDVKPLVEELIELDKILVVRGKEDVPRVIFYNDYMEACEMDNEFKEAWLNIRVPGETDLKNALQLDGLKTIDVFERKQLNTDKPVKKARKSNANMKKTNTHMMAHSK